MVDRNNKLILEILKKPGNHICADCLELGPEWASYNLGVFVCTNCAGIHRKLGSHVSRIKSVKLDNWNDTQITNMSSMGNLKAREKYETQVPLCYRKPTYKDPHVLKEEWIRAKYEREEFIHVDKQIYLTGHMESYLWKRGKNDDKFQLRKFVLDQPKDTLKYFVKENKEPKAVIRISELNATIVPEKIGNPNSMQLSYMNDGSTRNIFIYAEDGKDIVDWYTAIRSAKLNRLRVAFPHVDETQLSLQLVRDFVVEGYLEKTGPKSSDSYRRRWFTLDDRKLMYSEDPLAAYPKGEIFLGNFADKFAIRSGIGPGCKDNPGGFTFTLKTPDRTYLLSAGSQDERHSWIEAINAVILRPLTPQDNGLAAYLVRKRSAGSTRLSLFKPR